MFMCPSTCIYVEWHGIRGTVDGMGWHTTTNGFSFSSEITTFVRTCLFNFQALRERDKSEMVSFNSPKIMGLLSGSKIPFCMRTSLLARTDIFLSNAVNKSK